jgi:hypothetical protein
MIKDTTRFRIASVALLVATSLGVAACSANDGSTSSTVHPAGSKTGTFRYCSYTPVEDGIKVHEDESVPCLVADAREADDRKSKRHTPAPRVSPRAKKTSGSNKSGTTKSRTTKRR